MKLNEKLLTKSYAVVLLSLFCCFLWGSSAPGVKLGYEYFSIPETDNLGHILFAGIRFTMAGVLTIIFGSLLNGKMLVPKKSSIKMVLAISLFQIIIQETLFCIGVAVTPGSTASILNGLSVFATLIFSAAVFKLEKITRNKAIGCILGFIGIVILNLNGDFRLNFSYGEVLLIIGIISCAFSTVLLKVYSVYENPVTLTGWQFLFGGLVLMTASFLAGGRISPTGTGSYLIMLYLAFLSAAAFSIWGILLRFNPMSRISVFSFAQPIFGVVLSIILLSDRVDIPRCLAALVFVCAGIFLVNRTAVREENEK